MDHALGVGELESFGDLQADSERLDARNRTLLEAAREGIALDELHRQEIPPSSESNS